MAAFRFRLGLFKFLVTLFDLMNAPATFQRYINERLREPLDLDATTYMDDILVSTSASKGNHWKTVRSVLCKLQKASLYLDIDKCDFLCEEVKYLGLIIGASKSITVD